MDKLRIIQCGVGGHGAGWLKLIATSEEAQHAALVDINAAQLAQAATAANVPADRCFSALSDALRKVEADAVLTVTPPAIHYQHAREAFAAGKHLLSEKPIADTVEHGMEMVRTAQKAGRQLMISQNYRYRPEPRLLRRMVADQVCGTLVHGDVVFCLPADFRGSFRETMEYPTLVDMSIHHFDLMRYICNSDADTIFVHSFHTHAPEFQHEAAFKAVITFQNKVVFSYGADWTARRTATSWNGNWTLQCSEGALAWTGAGVSKDTRNAAENKWQAEKVDVPGLARVDQAFSLHEFVCAVRENRPAETSGHDNLQSFGMVAAGLESIRTGRPVRVADVVPSL